MKIGYFQNKLNFYNRNIRYDEEMESGFIYITRNEFANKFIITIKPNKAPKKYMLIPDDYGEINYGKQECLREVELTKEDIEAENYKRVSRIRVYKYGYIIIQRSDLIYKNIRERLGDTYLKIASMSKDIENDIKLEEDECEIYMGKAEYVTYYDYNNHVEIRAVTIPALCDINISRAERDLPYFHYDRKILKENAIYVMALANENENHKVVGKHAYRGISRFNELFGNKDTRYLDMSTSAVSW